VVAANDDQNVAAFAYGPVILAGVMGSQGLKEGAPLAHNPQDFAKAPVPADIRDTLAVKGKDPADWLKPVPGKPLEFTTAGLAGAPVTLVPYYEISRGRYIIYWKVE
jgi:hypothetical protein